MTDHWSTSREQYPGGGERHHVSTRQLSHA
jgi:hypothetical protein